MDHFQEMRALIDEALVRVGGGWVISAEYSPVVITNPGKPYAISVYYDNGLKMRGYFTDRTVQGQSTRQLPEARCKLTESSVKVANAISLKIIPQLDSILIESLAIIEAEKKRIVMASEWARRIAEVCPDFISTPYATYHNPGVTYYASETFYTSATPQNRVEVVGVTMHGFVPSEIAIEIFRMLKEYNDAHPRDPREEVLAAEP